MKFNAKAKDKTLKLLKSTVFSGYHFNKISHISEKYTLA